MLQPPFVVVEDDDAEALFFESLDDIRGDTFDILWGEQYFIYDCTGRRGRIERQHKVVPAFFKMFRREVEMLEIVSIEDGDFRDEVRAYAVSTIEAMARNLADAYRIVSECGRPVRDLNLDELIALGLRVAGIPVRR